MRHYFINTNHTSNDYFTFEEMFKDCKFRFKSCNDVFSKNMLDYGSLCLVNNILKDSAIFKGNILDVGCGYGAISILLDRFLEDAKFTLVDINSTAVALSKENVTLNHSKNIVDVFESDVYSNVLGVFDHIVSNPPIKTGKQVLIDLITKAYDHLNTNGTITIVIKKNYGADSAKDLMNKVFGNALVLDRDKGYYILRSKKIGK